MIEIKDATDAVIYLGTVAAALLGIGAVARYAVVRPLRRWLVEQVAQPVQQVATEVGAGPDSSDPEAPTLRDLVVLQGDRLEVLEQRFNSHMAIFHR